MTETKYGEDSDQSDIEQYMSSDSDSDGSSDTSSEDEINMVVTNIESNCTGNNSNVDINNEQEEDEEEDEVIKAIKREKEKPREHPPNITCPDDIVEISFHPTRNLLAVATIVGDVLLYKYTNEECELVETFELHYKACRDIEFDSEGNVLFSASKDKSINLTDVLTGKLIKCFDDAHENPIYSIYVIDDKLFATGDDDGCVKFWDARSKDDKCIFSVKKNEDYISDMVTNQEKRNLICSSGDGSITTIDLVNRQYRLQSEEYDEEFTCLGLVRVDTKLVAGTTKGQLYIFNWNEFGLHSDQFPGPTGINSMIPITENIVVTACENGVLRATHLFPHKHLGVVGQHDLSVENIDISHDGTFIASSGVGSDIKFWNIRYFENFNKLSYKEKNKKTDLKNYLPSSKLRNVSDFFADLQE